METSYQTAQNEPSTSQRTRNWLQLGHTAGQRAAEIVAGIRANTFPSPEAEGLSTPNGRRFARLLTWINGDAAVSNATGGRHLCLTHLAEEVLNAQQTPKIIVELAAGFSGRGLQLARRFPQARVFEVDLPDVVAVKRSRVEKLTQGAMPSNLQWISANLEEVGLATVMGAETVDLVIAEGLLPYFSPDTIVQIAASVRESLSRQGAMITDIVSSRGWSEVETKSAFATWMLKRQVGKFKAKMDSKDMAQGLFKQAGYSRVQVYSLQEMASQILPNLPMADVSFLITAHK